ncbi:hypothetical protein [uncultured Sphingomonas sp.]|uniref:hypothetical protein n=1 Tax=uncultured Sphingomonas sp. TaxID=158754 RepID=UPI0025DF60AA|nr:hypothetical protein [uncultured Sphingomonas sp.]
MARLRFLLLALGAIVAAEALFRLVNDLPVDGIWLLRRMTVYMVPSSISLFAGSDRARPGLFVGLVAMAMGGAGVVIFGWRAADAIWRGELLVSDRPKLYSGLTTNPVGFEVGVGFLALAVLASLAFLIGGAKIIAVARKRRFSGPGA